MSKPLLIDTFAGSGGAAKGYTDAGFDVIGIDNVNQPLYPYRFIQGDAMEFLQYMVEDKTWNGIEPEDVGWIHASPPCPAYSTMNNRPKTSTSPKLIEPVRTQLRALANYGTQWVIESVEGARSYMENPLRLHGGMFGMRIYRPRLFETNAALAAPPRGGRPKNPVSVYGRYEDGRVLRNRVDGTQLVAASLREAQEAMGMPWADWTGIRNAVPPAYTEWIGRQLLTASGWPVQPTLADRVRALICSEGRDEHGHTECWHLAEAADILEARGA